MSRPVDPVCHMEVDQDTAAGESEYKGRRYFFCSPRCKAEFEKEPSRYAGEETRRRGCCR
ncbi:MAG: YHS domain-containing protein [Firmicutes bacterium]|nr:YHS domain-containing protein [Bacillota bacterium]